jgi:hypothetical protein
MPRPIALDTAAADGATFAGLAVRKLWAELPDGRVVRLELPAVSPAPVDDFAEDEPDDEVRLTPTQRRIVDVFAAHEPEDALKGVVIARLLGEDLANLKKPLSELVKVRVLAAREREPGYFRGDRFDATR